MRSPLRRDLKYINLEGSSYCLMQGLGESSLPAFVMALGFGQHAAGLIATLPKFLGSILQNFSPAAILKVGSLRRFSVMTVSAQALAFVPLALAAWTQVLPLWLIFAAVALYWAGGLSTGAAWNTWMETVVPRSIRPRYFARRSAFCNLLWWSSMLAAGALLSKAHEWNLELTIFGVIFLIAGLARAAGAYAMSQQSETRPLPEGFSVLGFAQATKVLRCSPEGGLLLYLLAAQASLNIALPFLGPYLLGPLHLGYWKLMAIQSTAVLASIITLPILSNYARRLGTRGLLTLSGIGLSVVPLLWLWSTAPLAYYLGVQVLTGSLMAAYDLAVMFVYMETIPAAQRTSVLTRFRLFDTLAMFGGSMIGGGLLLALGQNTGAYKVIFLVSCLARLASLRILSKRTAVQPNQEPVVPAPLQAEPIRAAEAQTVRYRRRHRTVHFLLRVSALRLSRKKRLRTLVPPNRVLHR